AAWACMAQTGSQDELTVRLVASLGTPAQWSIGPQGSPPLPCGLFCFLARGGKQRSTQGLLAQGKQILSGGLRPSPGAPAHVRDAHTPGVGGLTPPSLTKREGRSWTEKGKRRSMAYKSGLIQTSPCCSTIK